MANPLVKRSALPVLLKKLRRAKKRIVFTNGVFDLLHRGHVEYLTRAQSYGDVLIVGLNRDASVRRLKGKGRPIQSESDRGYILSALEVVDYVVLFGEDTPTRLIKEISPDVLVKGADYQLKEIAGADLVLASGGRVIRVKLTRGRSTSRILDKLG